MLVEGGGGFFEKHCDGAGVFHKPSLKYKDLLKLKSFPKTLYSVFILEEFGTLTSKFTVTF